MKTPTQARAARKRYCLKYPNRVIKQQIELRTRRIMAARQLKIDAGGKCILCGFDDSRALVWHHKNPNIKEGTISNLVADGRNMHTIIKETKKCALLCANCHMILHAVDLQASQSDTIQEVEPESPKNKTGEPCQTS